MLKCLNQRRATRQQYSNWHIPQRKLFKHLSIAQHISRLWFCCFDFVYSSLSRSAGFILCCLNLFPTNVIPQHKRMKEPLNEKHNLFHLRHESITRAALLNALYIFLKPSEDHPLDWTKECIDSDMFISMAKAVGFPERPSHLAFVVCVSTGRLPVTFMGGFLNIALTDMGYCSLWARIS